jgi:hypothetical protein
MVQVSAGEYHTCPVRSDGSLWCWGFNIWGNLGDGTTLTRLNPVQVTGDTSYNVAKVAAGDDFTCALRRHRLVLGGEWNP